MIPGFIASLALALLTLLDVRRGVLFAAYPVRTFFLVFNPWHIPMFVVAAAGMLVCYRRLRACESPLTSRWLRSLTLVILALLIADLFAYRGVAAARSIASDRLAVDWLAAFGVTAWWKPAAQATSCSPGSEFSRTNVRSVI